MTETIFLLSEALACFLRICLCIVFLAVSENRSADNFRIGKCVPAAAIALAVSVLTALTEMDTVIDIAVNAAVISVIADKLINTERRAAMLFSFIYELGCGAWIFILTALFTETGIAGRQAALWTVTAAVLSAGIYSLIKNRLPETRVLYAAVFAGFFSITAINEFSETYKGNDEIFSWLILIMVLLALIMVSKLNHQHESEKAIADMKLEQAELLEREYNILNKSYSENARLFHDMHNHLGIIRSCISNKNYEKAAEYIDELYKPVSEMTSSVWTGDESVDYLINSKLAAAKKEGITVNANIEFPHNTNIKSADLCAVVGNLLDNALDAVRKNTAPEKRYINITVRRINRMIVIKTENPFEEGLIRKDGAYKTTKKEKGIHGWGLKSAAAAVEKYDGVIKITSENNVFCAVATMSF